MYLVAFIETSLFFSLVLLKSATSTVTSTKSGFLNQYFFPSEYRHE